MFAGLSGETQSPTVWRSRRESLVQPDRCWWNIAGPKPEPVESGDTVRAFRFQGGSRSLRLVTNTAFGAAPPFVRSRGRRRSRQTTNRQVVAWSRPTTSSATMSGLSGTATPAIHVPKSATRYSGTFGRSTPTRSPGWSPQDRGHPPALVEQLFVGNFLPVITACDPARRAPRGFLQKPVHRLQRVIQVGSYVPRVMCDPRAFGQANVGHQCALPV